MNRRELSPRYALTGSSRTPVERSTQHSLTLPSAKKHPQSISPASCLQHRVLMFYNGLLFPLRVVPCGHPSPYLRRCLERFDRFCKAHDRDRQTDRPTKRQTNHAHPSVTIGRINIVLRSGLKLLQSLLNAAPVSGSPIGRKIC